ncbi:histidine phosphatase family protein [Fervidobacterium thailandense]|uniref:Phosphoglycerate mutase n=1 Tax=Fervidobacterium thailandense TaxID=1008305 RepID=A0A1E3G3Q8_9BACT|nr:histidine phosphatase family protein [Fervidobacterium thailandense]ODN30916.1 phosphoglycerate mutase [Fervidobacterium thailandense]
MRIYLVRHASTPWNEQGLWQGVVDTELSERGILEAKRVAEFFKGRKIDLIVSSPMRRAFQTAQIIAQEIGYNGELMTDERLRECEIRLWNGMTTDELLKTYPKEFFEWFNNLDSNLDGVESLRSVQERMYEFVESLMLQFPIDDVIIVSHAIALRMLISRVLGITPPNHINFGLDNASVSILESNSKKLRVTLLNWKM